MTNLVSLRTLLGLSIALSAMACTSRSRSIEVPTPKPTNNDDALPPGGDDDQGRDASATLSIPQEIAQKYLDPNGSAEYKFKYLDVEQDGAVQFQNGNAIIALTSLPSGLEGKMELAISEAGVVKLAGSQEGVKLNSGVNKLTLTLKPVDGGNGNNGDKNADLQLEIVVEDGSGTATATGTATGTGTGTGTANFASIKAIATKSCFGVCHFHKDGDQEAFWTTRGKNTLIPRLTGEGVPSIMPPAAREPSEDLTDDERQKLLDYVNTL